MIKRILEVLKKNKNGEQLTKEEAEYIKFHYTAKSFLLLLVGGIFFGVIVMLGAMWIVFSLVGMFIVGYSKSAILRILIGCVAVAVGMYFLRRINIAPKSQ